MQMSGNSLQQLPMILQSDLATDRVGCRGNRLITVSVNRTFVIRQFHRLRLTCSRSVDVSVS